MLVSVIARFADAFIRGFFRTMKEKLIDGFLLLATACYWFFTGKLRAHLWEMFAPWIWVLSVIVVWHSFKAARQIASAPRAPKIVLPILSPAGNALEVDAPQEKLLKEKAFGIAFTVLIVMGGLSFLAYDKAHATEEVSASRHSSPNADRLRYLWIHPGTYLMGCSLDDNQCEKREPDAHEVAVKNGFCIGETEVTQAAYERVMGTNPSRQHREDPNWPVVGVTPSLAQEFCGRDIEGGRLPTEEEWEYAARAGTPGARYGDANSISWTRDNSGDDNSGNDHSERVHPHAVRTLLPNSNGLYDMLGNVWELTSGQMPGFNHALSPVVRGGAFDEYSRSSRASARSFISWSEPNYTVGFRCVKPADSAAAM